MRLTPRKGPHILTVVVGVAHWMIMHDVIEPDYSSIFDVGQYFAFHPATHTSLTTAILVS
jgi:hypothetical protein